MNPPTVQELKVLLQYYQEKDISVQPDTRSKDRVKEKWLILDTIDL